MISYLFLGFENARVIKSLIILYIYFSYNDKIVKSKDL